MLKPLSGEMLSTPLPSSLSSLPWSLRMREIFIALCLLPLGAPVLRGQTRAPAARASGITASNPQAVRAEYASVLLQAKRYDEAAAEYRRLLATDPASSGYRLGLVRSLAWGGRYLEAERELDPLIRARPRDGSLDSLRRSIRASYTPVVDEARGWVAERPEYAPYRLALIRSLARAGGDRRYAEAIAHLDTLIVGGASAPLFVERARINVARTRYAEARQDLATAIARSPSPEAYLLIGDIHRWDGDLVLARASYEQARALARREAPDTASADAAAAHRAIAAAFVQLIREERPPIAFAPISTDAIGWQLGAEAIEDNAGLSYHTLGARRGFSLGPATVGSVGVDWRTLAELDSGGESRRVQVGAVDVGASRTFTLGQLAARGGLAVHPAGTTVPYGSLSAVAWLWTWNLSVEAAVAPAYPTLLTMASLLPSDAGGGRPLSGRSSTVTLAGPIAASDVAVSGQITRLGDGNARSTLQAFVRHPLAPRWSVAYAASSIRFDERSALYWDPVSYFAHSVGVEMAERAPRGFSYAVRLLPGIARSEEAALTEPDAPPATERRYLFQISGGGEWSYRARQWDVGGSVAYGRGRADGYERLGANIYLRLLR